MAISIAKKIKPGTTGGEGTTHSYPTLREPEYTPAFKWGSCCPIMRFLCSVLFILL